MADVGRDLADRELRKLERKLSHEYAQAEKELRKKREEFTKEYQKELKKKKALLEKGELTKEKYKQWLEQQALYESWVSEMADYMASEQVNVNRRAAEIMNNATPKVYAEAFNFGTFLVEDASGVNTAFELYNVDTVANLITKDPELLPEANIDIPKDKRWNYQKMKTSLVQSVLQGESVSKMAKRLRRVTDMNKTSAIRNARTMFVGAENGGRLGSFQRAVGLGVEMKKMWSATMDSRTRDSHAVLDGETVELNEKFSNGLMYPGDPDGSPSEVYNCRCRLSAQLAGFERNNRHIVDGENVTEEQYLKWKSNHLTDLNDASYVTVRKFLTGNTTDRMLMASNALATYDVKNVPVKIKSMKSFGRCRITFEHGKPAKVVHYALNKNDGRSIQYQLKTSFHEAFHAAIDGRKHDRLILGDLKWKWIEETFAETSALYMMNAAGVVDMVPNYGVILTEILPRLKRVKGFENCSTLVDFGEKAYNLRKHGGGGVWGTLHSKIASQKIGGNYLQQYIPIISKDLDDYAAKIAESEQRAHRRYNKKALAESMNKILNGQQLDKNQLRIFHTACAIAMNRVGVL